MPFYSFTVVEVYLANVEKKINLQTSRVIGTYADSVH